MSNRNASWERLDHVPPDPVLFGRSAVMAEVRQRAEKICRTNVPILLCGEGGTGKEALARWIHVNSEYASGEFVKVSCAAIPGTLLESELFGYEQGAFTGANVAKPGRVEMAHRGTLFLDEIAELDPNLQSKLLRFLQDLAQLHAHRSAVRSDRSASNVPSPLDQELQKFALKIRIQLRNLIQKQSAAMRHFHSPGLWQRLPR